MPVYLISGTCDWVCPVASIQEYAEEISAPNVRMELIEGCGHNLQYSSPEEVANAVMKVLTAPFFFSGSFLQSFRNLQKTYIQLTQT